ncbi:dehydrogenase/reductase SDR family member 11-like [Lingula anatina]|uniref:Dehydrogenase/reductase SDR family member 11-like n=1 Tax=Lingula anatina TaxID=7574 RepID=A0A1S3HRB4_LINAN|nr:dehydrogenase/reductase SDR family member 11-like [Lingula anatina]XP_013388581.1 dehydrogenase/reductase SDR family member 11-like [Lingula anatina]XP_013388582.1 dehydrogenase/reductase SDR family member 11-like [Lingula anatina]XP_013388583.1 dehydrogenase/reductase SDR family member 11-like [Lingula anatina]|eukprot:XP_013388580.1 dehydrogenase/reductase SDR family member 11-like [Lingula anatina]
MDRWAGRVALVTGASKGMGEAIARSLVKNGMVVVGCARHVEGMQKAATGLEGEKGRLIPMKCDLTKTEEIESMFQKIKEQLGGVDVCVNNAGVNFYQDCKTGPLSDTKTLYDVNVFAVITVSQLTIQSIQERNRDDGHIINISSVCGSTVHADVPCHMYTPTKQALNAFTEGLRHELRKEKTKIRTTVISPALVDTPLVRGLFDASFFCPEYSLQPDDVAAAVTFALSAPPCVNVRHICLHAIHDSL